MVVFTGDINLTDWIFNVGFGIGSRISTGFDPFMYFERNESDKWVGNFEGVASKVSVNRGIYSKAFRVDPEVLSGLHHMDYYGFANNHAMEHGGDAFLETVKALTRYGCEVFGLIAKKSIVFEHQGRVVSLTGLCLRIEATKETPLYWHNPEYTEIEDEVNALPKEAFKVFYIHWGNEYINRPSSAQKKFAHWLIDLGVDLSVGMHPHVIQGYEDYNGGRIYYSLGNCIFDMPSEQCRIGALVCVDFVNNEPTFTEKYLIIDNKCYPHVVSERDVPQQWHFDHLNRRRKIDDNTEEYHQEIKKGYYIYRRANRKRILMMAMKHPSLFFELLKDFIKRKI